MQLRLRARQAAPAVVRFLPKGASLKKLGGRRPPRVAASSLGLDAASSLILDAASSFVLEAASSFILDAASSFVLDAAS